MTTPIFHLSWDPKWTRMTRRSSSPQELLPHDVDTYYAERSVLPSRFYKNQIFINGYTAKGEKFETQDDDHGRVDFVDKEKEALVDQLQLRKVAKEEKPTKASSPYNSEVPYRIQVFQNHWTQALNKQISLPETQKRFFMIYLRNWESDFASSLSRTEKFMIDAFKQQHEKINQDEWKFFWNNVRHIDAIKLKERSKSFAEFITLVNQPASPTPMHSLSSSPSDSNEVQPYERSMLSALLQKSSMQPKIVHLEEIKKLYFCIYFQNYSEIWCDDILILNAWLKSCIESFLQKFPILPADIVQYLQSCLERKRDIPM